MILKSFGKAPSIAALTLVTACGQNTAPVSAPLPSAAGSSSIHVGTRPLASRKASYIYVSTDYGTQAVDVLSGDVQGKLVDTITQGVSEPLGLAVDKSGTLYVANNGNGTVTEYPAGQDTPSVTLQNGLSYPNSIAIDRSGDVWVADGSNVVEYAKGSQSQELTLTSGVTGAAGVAVDAKGAVYVVNAGNSSPDVLVFPPGATQPKTTFGQGDLVNPCGVTLDKKGNVYVGDFSQGQVYVFAHKTYKLLRTVNHSPYFSEPCGVTIDKHNRLYQGGGGGGSQVNLLQIPKLGKGSATVFYEVNGIYGVAADPTIEP